MTLIPGIKQIRQVGNDMYAQGAISGAGIGTTEVSYLADPADTRLLAGRDPVLQEVSVGMSGVKTELKYATGAQPLTVADAMLGNLTYCQVQFSPKQDLNGYDSPWPAGGGKNKIDFTVQDQGGLTAVKQDGKAVISGTAVSGAYPIDLILTDFPAGTYVWSIDGLKTGMSAAYTKNGAWAGYLTQGATFTLTETSTIGGYVSVSSGTETNTTVSIMLELGSTASDFAPYENICPITGATNVNVYVAESYDPAVAPEATVSLGAERFGGTADLVSGIGSETIVKISFPTSGWTRQDTLTNTLRVSFSPTGMENIGGNNSADIMCSEYPVIADTSDTIHCMHRYSAVHVFIDKAKYPNLAAWEAYLATLDTTPELSYKFATPTTFTFSGANDITLQEGTNTIWTDTNGTDISVTYVTKK